MPRETFPALTHVSSFGSSSVKCSYTARVVWLFFFLRINSTVELLIRSQKTQVQAQFHTCVSAGRRSWHMITVISYVHCGNTSPAEDEDFIMLCRDVSSLTCSWASPKALTQPVPVHEGLLEWAAQALALQGCCRALPGKSRSCSGLELLVALGRLKEKPRFKYWAGKCFHRSVFTSADSCCSASRGHWLSVSAFPSVELGHAMRGELANDVVTYQFHTYSSTVQANLFLRTG